MEKKLANGGVVKVSVHEEILGWSQDRPAWQRDGLRRLVTNGELSEDDFIELTEICKSVHGLFDRRNSIPLAKEHLPDRSSGSPQVTLVSIFHRQGVNALAENQTLKFGANLTVVYGDNAAGKTGYIRILKSACRARGQEKILGNVVSGSTPLAPTVSIKYSVGTEENFREWSGRGEDDSISRVSVFDTQCATVYLTEKTDVAFRPLHSRLKGVLVISRGSSKMQRNFIATDIKTAMNGKLVGFTASCGKRGNVALKRYFLAASSSGIGRACRRNKLTCFLI